MSGAGTISIPADRMAQALASVLPHVSKDKTRPGLNAVHVCVDRGHLLFEATDCYTIAIHRTPAVAKVSDDQTIEAWWDGDLDIIIGADDAKRVMALAKGVVAMLPVTIAVGENGWVEASVVAINGLRFRAVDGDFPKVRQFVPPVTDPPASHLSFGPKNMAKVTASALALKGRDKAAPSVIMLNGKGAASPQVFTIGDDFLGLLMPVRVEDPSAARSSWDGLL